MSVELLRFETIIEKLRDLDPEMQMQAALTLSIVARKHSANQDCSVKEIGEYLGLSSASASRNIAVLSKWNRHGVPGKDLVEARENPRKRVEKFVKLTVKGEKWIAELENIVAGKTPTYDLIEAGESRNKQAHLANQKERQRKQEEVRRRQREEKSKNAEQAYRANQERDA